LGSAPGGGGTGREGRGEPAGTECCVVSGDAGCEAYTGSAKPCDRASKEKSALPSGVACWSRRRSISAPTTSTSRYARGGDPDGVQEHRRTRMGAPGNLGGLVVFTEYAGRTTR